MLKPVNSVELTNVFTQMKIKLDEEISEKKNVQVLQNYYLESLPLLQVNFYSTLIEGRIQAGELQKYLSDYQISLEGPCDPYIFKQDTAGCESVAFICIS